MTTLASLYCDACGMHSCYSDTRALAAQTPGWEGRENDLHACPTCARLPVSEYFDRVIERCITPPKRVARAITKVVKRSNDG